jgi:hypothetical protein
VAAVSLAAIDGYDLAHETWKNGGLVRVDIKRPDGATIDYFNTNAEDFARWRIAKKLGWHPDSVVTLTPERD